MIEAIENFLITYGPTIASIVTVIVAFIKILGQIKTTLKSSTDNNQEVKDLVKEVVARNNELLADNRDLKRQNRELKERLTHVKEKNE